MNSGHCPITPSSDLQETAHLDRCEMMTDEMENRMQEDLKKYVMLTNEDNELNQSTPPGYNYCNK